MKINRCVGVLEDRLEVADGVLMNIKLLIESTVDDPEDLPELILSKVDAYFLGVALASKTVGGELTRDGKGDVF